MEVKKLMKSVAKPKIYHFSKQRLLNNFEIVVLGMDLLASGGRSIKSRAVVIIGSTVGQMSQNLKKYLPPRTSFWLVNLMPTESLFSFLSNVIQTIFTFKSPKIGCRILNFITNPSPPKKNPTYTHTEKIISCKGTWT